MAERTLGKPGTRFAWCAYVFIHYTLLVAYISKVGEITGEALGIPVPIAVGPADIARYVIGCHKSLGMRVSNAFRLFGTQYLPGPE